MKKIELLAPAGDKESLIAAIQNGADAIYLGGTMFNARAFAKNFDTEELKWAVQYAHLNLVKIYVTVNTLYRDDEFENLIQYLDYLYDIQVDALIIQDIGLFHVVKNRYPDFEIHMSTQASIMNSYAAKYFENNGASRIVLARENTLEEIRNICMKTSLEVEVFVHGALCVCYSGQCLMSSFIGKRSGNRGQCAQPCRLQYQLKKDNEILDNKIPFLLSPKDLMTIQHIGELIEAGVTSFKIEGRMKRPEYVASVVRAYRHAIDSYLNNQKHDLKQDINFMKAMFNRDYTSGYAFSDKNLLIGDYSGNKGVVLGKVLHYNKKNKRVTILLHNDLYQGDSIVFEKIDKGRPVNKIYLQNKLVSSGHKGDKVEIEFDFSVYEGVVRKTVDTQVINDLKQTYNKIYRKQPIKMLFQAHIDQPAKLILEFGSFRVEKKSILKVEKALKTPLSEERISSQLSKLGQTPFYIESIAYEIDKDMSFSIKELNNLRREAIDEISFILSHHLIHHQNKNELHILESSNTVSKRNIHVLVSNIAQLKAIIHQNIDLIYYPFQHDVNEAFILCQQHDLEMALFIPRIMKDEDIDDIKNSHIYHHIKYVVVNDYGTYYAFGDKQRILGTGLNIFNSYAINAYHEPTILSLEMTKKQINQLKYQRENCYIQIYGKIENMISEYCPISQYYFGYQHKNCQLCKKGKFSLIDRKKEEFPILTDEKCRMHLLNCRTLWIDPNDIQNSNYFIHFTNEDYNTTKLFINEIIDCVQFQNDVSIKEKTKTTFGYFKP